MPEDRAKRVKRYRLLAEEIRSAACSMKTESGETLLRMAKDYDALADHLECLATTPLRKRG
jgi:hypothetical protein